MNKKSLVLIPAVLLLLSACGNGGKTSGTTSETHDTTTSEVETVAVTGITLNKTEATLEIGENVTLTASVTPTNATNKSVTWSVDHSEVATVDRGRVTAVAAGTATVTATSVDGNFKAECTITVNAASDYGTETNPLTADQAYELCKAAGKGGYTAEPVWCKGIVYTSSYYASKKQVNGYLASDDQTVDQKIQLYGVTVAEGVTFENIEVNDAMVGYEIVVCGYMQNYNDTNMEFVSYKPAGAETAVAAEIKSFTAPTQAATGVRVLGKATLGLDRDEWYQLNARLIPLNSVGTIEWVSSDETVASVVKGLVSAKAVGTANIKAKVGSIESTPVALTVSPDDYVAKCNFKTLNASNSAYNNTWSYNDWSIKNGANNNAAWEFVKLGAKSLSKATESSISSKVAASAAVGSVSVNIISTSTASTLFKDTEMAVVEYGVRVASDAKFENVVDTVVGTTTITKGFNQVVTFNPTSGSSWNTGLYYQVYFSLTNSGTTNGIVCIEYVQLNNALPL